MVDQSVIEKIIKASLTSIASLMDDPKVTEIMVTADGVVWVERSGSIEDSGIVLAENDRQFALTSVAKAVNRDLRANTENAIVSTSIGGLRFAGALMPVDSRGTTLCIRKHLPPENRPSLEQLVAWQMLSPAQAGLLERLIIVEKKNAVFVGATSSGKTTTMNAILAKLPMYERIGVIEDAQELALKVPNKDCYLTNVQVGITSRVLIQHAMRSRYDRLVVGESRGEDTFDLIRALSSGHNGSITTIHGSSAREGLGTLEMLYQMSVPAGANVPVDVAKRYIAAAINLLIYTERRYEPNGAGGFKSVRCVKEIALVKGVRNEDYEIEYL
jgi:pilus assembly protein CpaF